MFRNEQPYNDLAMLPPPQASVESIPILRLHSLASRALGELKASAALLPNPLILVQALVLQEAQQSSEIENILTTHDELYRAIAMPEDAQVSPQTKEVLRYREAMTQGFEAISHRPLTTNLIIELQEILIGNQAGIRKQPGTVIKNARTDEIIYTPPQGEQHIRALLANLEHYLHDEHLDTDPLIRMAVAHYQFEAIHPFYDGNGRTGRLMNVLYLIEQGLLTQPVLYLSAYFLRERAQYYHLLKSVTERQAWGDWVLYVLEGIRQTAAASTAKIAEIRAAMTTVEERIRSAAPKAFSLDLVQVLFQSPYAKFDTVANGIGVSYQTARTYLKALTDKAIVEERKLGRENYYLNTTLLDLLKQPLLPD